MLSREQSRAIDRRAVEQLGMPGIVLMENAGRGCAEILWNQFYSTRASTSDSFSHINTLTLSQSNSENRAQRLEAGFGIVVCCGPGSNGGDGLVIARHLWLAGLPVKVILASNRNRYRGDSLTNLQIIEKLKLDITESPPDWAETDWVQNLSSACGLRTAWIVDALLGTGFQGVLAGPIRVAVESINQTQSKRLAVDIPSGLDCDTGDADGCAIKADITCTFVAPKIGFNNPKAAPFLGRIVVVGIGVPTEFGNS